MYSNRNCCTRTTRINLLYTKESYLKFFKNIHIFKTFMYVIQKIVHKSPLN